MIEYLLVLIIYILIPLLTIYMNKNIIITTLYHLEEFPKKFAPISADSL